MKKIVALFGKNKEEILRELKKIDGYSIDIVEIRADYLNDISTANIQSIIDSIRGQKDVEIILTLRTKREGGNFDGLDYSTRIQSFLDLNMDYIDFQMNELTDQNMGELVAYAKNVGVKTVLSVHYMNRGISKGIFQHYLNKANMFGSDFVKIVDYPKDRMEVINKLILSGQYASTVEKPGLISISMGDLGVISRFETNLYKPNFTFINISDHVQLGQITLEEMEEKLAQKGMINFYTTMNTVLGRLYIYSDLEGVSEISFEKPRLLEGVIDIKYEDPILRETVNQLNEYFTLQRKDFELKTSITGSDFERKVYDKLSQVAYGSTVSYKELADMVGCEDGARAVGNAMAKNKLPIIIPCHRVVKSTGDVGEYIGGKYRKQILIALEKED